jgi:cell division septation protein DedD
MQHITTSPTRSHRFALVPLSSLLVGLLVSAASAATPLPTVQPTTPAGSIAATILDGYRDAAGLLAGARSLSGPNVSVVTIGRSREGRDLVAVRLGTSSTTAKPAILITAGLDGLHLAGSEVALRVASTLLSDETLSKRADLFERVTIWIVPCANPDALEATLHGSMPQRGTLRPVDDDRDGAVDEDGPRDIDGDGMVLEMRVKNPAPPYVATLIADPSDARLLKAPETGVAAKGFEAPVYVVLPEGDDVDGDGRIAEDGRGEVDLNRNFPHRYPELTKDAGPNAVSEPESKALADFVLAHPEIVAAITYGRHDSLVKVPEGRDNDATGRTPLVYTAGDIELYQAIGKLYRDTTGQARAGNADNEGNFWLWLADHRGILSVASTVWGRPDLPKPEAPKPEDAKPAETKPAEAKPAETKPADAAPAPTPAEAPRVSLGMLHDPDEDEEDELNPAGFQTVPAAGQQVPPAGPGGPPGGPPGGGAGPGQRPGQGGPGAGQGGGRGRRGGFGGGAGFQPRGGPAAPTGSGASDAESAEWLAYSDKMRDGVGFVAWHEVAHPVFGFVEVGGFHPLFKLNPPANEFDALAAKQTAFVLELIDRLPTLAIPTPTVTSLGSGLYRIEASVMNSGRLPTVTAMGVTTRARLPVVARISSGIDSIVNGERVRKIETLAPGARVGLDWIVRAAPDELVTVSIGNVEYGVRSFSVKNGSIVEGAR